MKVELRCSCGAALILSDGLRDSACMDYAARWQEEHKGCVQRDAARRLPVRTMNGKACDDEFVRVAAPDVYGNCISFRDGFAGAVDCTQKMCGDCTYAVTDNHLPNFSSRRCETCRTVRYANFVRRTP